MARQIKMLVKGKPLEAYSSTEELLSAWMEETAEKLEKKKESREQLKHIEEDA